MGGEEEVHRPLSTMEGGSDFRKEKSEKIEAEWKKETRLKNIAFAKDLWVLHLLSEVIMYLPTDTYWIPTMLSGTVPALGRKQGLLETIAKVPFSRKFAFKWET